MFAFDLDQPSQRWTEPDQIVVGPTGQRICDLQTIDDCYTATALIKASVTSIEQCLAHEADNRILMKGQRFSRARDSNYLARLNAHRRNAKTALQTVDKRRGQIARVEKDRIKAENIERAKSGDRFLLEIVRELDNDLFRRVVEEARRRRPDLIR